MSCDTNDLLQYFLLGQEGTKTSIFLHTLNSFADIMTLVPENISQCKYHDLNFQNSMLNSSQNLFLLYLNIRSLQKNYNKLRELLDQLPTRPHFIGLPETKIKHQPFLDISFPNYHFIYAALPKNARRVGLYISDSFNYEILGTNSIHTSGCESLLSSLTSSHLPTIGVIYQHPKYNIAHFTDEFSKTLDLNLNQPNDLMVVVVVLPKPFRGMGRGGTPLRPNKRATPQGLDHRSRIEREQPKIDLRRGSRQDSRRGDD